MFERFLITGATGNLGRELSKKLVEAGSSVRALVYGDDPAEKLLSDKISVCRGDVGDKDSMKDFFGGELKKACLIHCAGLITIASSPPSQLWRINVEGTRNIMELSMKHGVRRVIYVSSVHAVPELKKGNVITEVTEFSPKKVKGHYAKSKAAATGIALEAYRSGLDVCVVHPSGILCPSDKGRGNISAAILRYCRGELPLAVKGGYDFVDVRDVADGIAACAERGRSGECYFLSGHYAALEDILGYVRNKIGGKKIHYLPLWLIQAFAPFYELANILKKEPLYLTPYSVYTLGSNAVFSHQKAASELGFRPRPLSSTLDDMVAAML